MRVYLADKKSYINATFEEVMSILIKNGNRKLTCLNNTK
jgi:hypothetical protein